MKIHRGSHSLLVSRAILRMASLFVPLQERSEWVAEWEGELWHVWQACKTASPASSHDNSEVVAFCLGAFQDAFWLRRNRRPSLPREHLRLGSPSRCGLSLVMLGMASIMVCICFPGGRRAMLPSPYPHPEDLVMVSKGGYSSAHLPTIQLADYESWTSSTRKLFTELAFYQPLRKRVHFAQHHSMELSVARATDNLFEVLKRPLLIKAPASVRIPELPAVILSQAAWRRYLHGDRRLAGQTMDIGGQQVQVIGVISENSWQLPGQIDAWVLEDERHLNALPSSSRGFVVARVNASGFPAGSAGQRYMVASQKPGEIDRYDCISLAQQAHEPVAIFLFTLLLACLALPATTPLPLGEYPVQNERLPSSRRLGRWLFLATKIALIVPVVYFSSLDLAYAGLPLSSPSAQYIQLVSSFFGFLFALRWALQDQRRRCPVCLRLLTNPARVGQASRNFLAWNGTELICSVGHGLLHIPELPTSWFSTQRWLYLDSSWKCLFSDSKLASAGIS